MANYSELIQTINDSIKANGNQEITGPVLNSVLQAMVGAMNAGFICGGVAEPSTNPGTPDANVFYFAKTPGEYVNFYNTSVNRNLILNTDEIAFVFTSVSRWSWWKYNSVSPDTLNNFAAVGSFATSKVQLVDQDNSGMFYDYVKQATYTQNTMVNTDGTTNAISGVSLSDYIELREGDTALFAITGLGVTLAFYDTGKTFIGYAGATSRQSANQTGLFILIPSNAKYIRINRSDTLYAAGLYSIYSWIRSPLYDVVLNDHVIPKPLVPESTGLGFLNSEASVGLISSGAYYTYDVSDLVGKKLVINTGRGMNISTQSDWVFVIYKNNAGSIISVLLVNDVNAGTIRNFVVTVPESAAQMILQASFNSGRTYVAELIDLNDNLSFLTEGLSVLQPYTYKTGYMAVDNTNSYFGGVVARYRVTGIPKIYIDADVHAISIGSNPAWALLRLIKSDGTILHTVEVTRPYYEKYELPIPPEAQYADILYSGSLTVFTEKRFLSDSYNQRISQWKGKKIIWLGTSIPWGQTSETDQTNPLAANYPWIVGKNLGAEVINVARPGMAIETTVDYKRKTYGSLSLSIAELTEQGYPTTPYQSYENAMLGMAGDLYVFDCEPNNSEPDLDIFTKFDMVRWAYLDGSSFESHRNTYAGAFIFLLDKLWNENPAAKVVMVGEYIKIASDFKTTYTIRESSLNLCEHFSIPYINVADKLLYNIPTLDVYLNADRVHPKMAAHVRIAEMLTHELQLIY